MITTSAASIAVSVPARAHGEADVGPCQRRRVVDAVAGHRGAAVALLQVFDGRQLVFGQQVAARIVDAGLRGRWSCAVAGLSPVSMTG